MLEGRPDWFGTCEFVGWEGHEGIGPVDDPMRFCRWCGTLDMPPRRRTWCSDRCRLEFLGNHFWPWARDLALRRCGACVWCGLGPGLLHEAREAIVREHGPGRHDVPDAVRVEYSALAFAAALEVDHIVALATLMPRQETRYADRPYAYTPSRHALNGCHHHQSNLRVLCHACHVERTTADRRAARGVPTPQPQGVLL